MPSTKSVAGTMSTQTNTNLCGSVEISDCSDEFRLNCFYCCESFLLEKWSQFVEHLKEQHLKEDPLFKIPNFPNCDHDYTTTTTESTTSLTKTCKYKWPTTTSDVKGINRNLKEVKTTGSPFLRLKSFKKKSVSDTESEDETDKSVASTIRSKGKVKLKQARPVPPTVVSAKTHIPRPPIKQVIITNKDEYIAKKVVQQTLLNIRKFEAMYKTVKRKPPKVRTNN